MALTVTIFDTTEPAGGETGDGNRGQSRMPSGEAVSLRRGARYGKFAQNAASR